MHRFKKNSGVFWGNKILLSLLEYIRVWRDYKNSDSAVIRNMRAS